MKPEGTGKEEGYSWEIKDAFERCDVGLKGHLTKEEKLNFTSILVNEYDYKPEAVAKALKTVEEEKDSKATLGVVSGLLKPNSPNFRSTPSLTSPSTAEWKRKLGISTAELMVPAARIIYVLQLIKKKCDLDKGLTGEVDWCIEQIGAGKIYESQLLTEVVPLKSPSYTQAMPWIAQFSTPKLKVEEIQAYLHDTHLIADEISLEEKTKKDNERAKRRSIMAQDIAKDISNIQAFMETVNSDRFDIVEAEKVLGRDKVLPAMAFHIFQLHNLFATTPIDENAFVAFISQIRKGYVRTNPYHNDIHAADVLQMCHFMLTKGGLLRLAKLNPLDVAAFLLSAIIHDFKHPGVTNGFLVNSTNDLALAYNDKSILESYHVSEAFKVAYKEKGCNLFEKFTNNERTVMRKRMISCVLATDMAVHNDMMTKLKNLIIVHNIRKGKNSEKVINPKTEFESKQFLLDFCLHVADVGNTYRDFPVYKELVLRLLEEFGRQGDVEKSMKLPISFLCDRTTVNLPVSQIGYIAGISKPMISLIAEVLPGFEIFLTKLNKNEAEWKKFGK